MTPVRFGLQAALVVTLGGVVSFPEQRQVRADALSPATPSASAEARSAAGVLDGYGRVSTLPDGRPLRIGYGSASEYAIGAKAAAALRDKLYQRDVPDRRRPTPGEVLAVGGRINAVVGYAQLRNGLVPFARVLLRNVLTGRVEARAIADENGRFVFVDAMPADYVIELLDAQGAVLAASEVMRIGVNDVRAASIRRAGGRTLASFGGQVTPAAQDTIEAAATQGVRQVSAPDRCASPPCTPNNP